MNESVTDTQKIEENNAGITAGVIVIGSIVDFDTQGRPLVDFTENPSTEPLMALSTLALSRKNISRMVALLFNDGDLKQPVIMGLIHNPLDELLDNFELSPVEEVESISSSEIHENDKTVESQNKDNTVYVDGKQVSIEGAEQVTFKCGKASITLTKSGKILIRGTYLLNRSTGVNRIMGGSVQIN